MPIHLQKRVLQHIGRIGVAVSRPARRYTRPRAAHLEGMVVPAAVSAASASSLPRRGTTIADDNGLYRFDRGFHFRQFKRDSAGRALRARGDLLITSSPSRSRRTQSGTTTPQAKCLAGICVWFDMSALCYNQPQPALFPASQTKPEHQTVGWSRIADSGAGLSNARR
jgi:hypothetical protein